MALEGLIKVFSYWDLNQPSKRAKYIFALQRAADPTQQAPELPAPQVKLSCWDQTWMYLGTVLGVLLSFLLRQMDSGVALDLTSSLTWFNVVVALFVALVVIPYAYKRVDVDPTTPFIVRLGLFVQNGVFWQVIMGLVGKTFK